MFSSTFDADARGMTVAIGGRGGSAMHSTIAPDSTATLNGFELSRAGILAGYRFRVATDEETFAEALAVRRSVYRDDFGYDVPVPDEYDRRSWLLVAETESDGEIIGTMRITPRRFGSLEAEEYFRLPSALAGHEVMEISRFAIRRNHRKTHSALPSVSLGLFKLCYEFVLAMGATCEIICSKPERVWMYEAMGFRSTGVVASYTKLNGAEHELLCHDFRTTGYSLDNELFRGLYSEVKFDEVVLPAGEPPIGLVDRFGEPLRVAAAAAGA
jgi:N-acyl-L-homoserine lactone synthetase